MLNVWRVEMVWILKFKSNKIYRHLVIREVDNEFILISIWILMLKIIDRMVGFKQPENLNPVIEGFLESIMGLKK